MERDIKQEAIDFINHNIDKHKLEIATAEKKRKEHFESYVTFWLVQEMESHANLDVLNYILEIIKTYDSPEEELLNYKEGLKHRVLTDRVTFSTSQGANLFSIARKNVYCDYCKNSYGIIDQVLRLYGKQDGN